MEFYEWEKWCMLCESEKSLLIHAAVVVVLLFAGGLAANATQLASQPDLMEDSKLIIIYLAQNNKT